MKKRTKILLIALCATVIVAGIAAAVILLSAESRHEQAVYVESVADIAGLGNAGLRNRYGGIVEAQDIKNIELDANKTLDECFVSVGDEVKVGDPLFSYDVGSLELAHEQLKLDLEGIKNNIITMNEQIDALKKQIKSASGDTKAALTLQMQALELNVRKEEYTRDKKQLEVSKAAEDITSNVVTSEIDGIVRSITPPGTVQDPGKGMYYPGQETNNAYMTLMSSEDFRIKGTISEQTVYLLQSGIAVTIRSRVDESVTWQGTIDYVNTEQPEGNANSGMSPMPDGRQQASKYAFYVTLASNEGLMMGQHVYIEPAGAEGAQADGLWLPEPYLVAEGNDFYVFTDNGHERLEKRKVTVGEFSEARGCYLILDGLTAKDYIAFPAENVASGAKTTKTITAPPVDGGGTPSGVLLPGVDDGRIMPEGDGKTEDLPEKQGATVAPDKARSEVNVLK